MVCIGVDAEYDQAISDIQSVEQALRDYLDQQKKILGCRVTAAIERLQIGVVIADNEFIITV